MVTLCHLLATQGGERHEMFGGGGFLAESSFPRPCLLLRDLGPHLDAATGSQDPALAQETLEGQGHRGL